MKDKGSIFTGGRVVTALALLLFLVYFVYQAFATLMPMTTGTAVHYTAYDGVQTVGTIIRDEKLLESNKEGVRYFVVGDGEKVSKNGTVANVYASKSEAQVYTDLKNLETRIAALKEVQSYNNTEAVDLNILNRKIDAEFISMIGSCQDGVYSDSRTYMDELLKLLNRKKIAVGEEQDYSGAITQLSSQYNSLSATAPTAIGTITSDVSGYFVSTVDGYEKILTSDVIKTLTPKQLDELKPEEVTDSAVGKVVSNYTWYIACTMSLKESARFKIGETVKLKTTLKTANELSVMVESINLGDDDRVVMVFSCHNMNGDLAVMRTIPITVVMGEYEGLRVSNKAVRIVDGKTGVYVISGMQAKFVEINILYSTSGYTLCKADNNKSGLRLYDEVIEKGKNLYDGKIIR